MFHALPLYASAAYRVAHRKVPWLYSCRKRSYVLGNLEAAYCERTAARVALEDDQKSLITASKVASLVSAGTKILPSSRVWDSMMLSIPGTTLPAFR
jgi:hypothetical protein